jgi:HAD superfamily hydrolase (TIGR01484 family)
MILFHDVDGCLNTPDGADIPASLDALTPRQRSILSELSRLVDQSAISDFVLNTGRGWQETGFLVEAIASTKLSYVLVEHGAIMWDVKRGTTVDLQALAKRYGLDEISEQFNSVNRVRTLIKWFVDEGSACLSEKLKHQGTLVPHGGKEVSLTISVPALLDGGLLLSTLRQLIESQTEFSPDHFVYHHGISDGFIDVTGAIDKGTGVTVLARHLGKELADTMAIGNGLNDLPMLEAVGLPICPANAEQPVKRLCQARGLVSNHNYINAALEWLKRQVP